MEITEAKEEPLCAKRIIENRFRPPAAEHKQGEIHIEREVYRDGKLKRNYDQSGDTD